MACPWRSRDKQPKECATPRLTAGRFDSPSLAYFSHLDI